MASNVCDLHCGYYIYSTLLCISVCFLHFVVIFKVSLYVFILTSEMTRAALAKNCQMRQQQITKWIHKYFMLLADPCLTEH